jgi:hypothetical protein
MCVFAKKILILWLQNKDMYKINSIFRFIIFAAALMLTGASVSNAQTGADTLTVARNSVLLADESSRYAVVKLTANRPWKASAPSWLRVEPSKGEVGETKIRIYSKKDNLSAADRKGLITIKAGRAQQTVELVQGAKGDFWRDGDILMLRRHTRGNGVAVALSGDGFDAGDLRRGGFFESECRDLVDTYMFTNPVFKDFEDLFDVYVLMSESHERSVLRGADNAFGSGSHMDFDAAARRVTEAGIPENRAWIFMGNGQIGGYALFEHRAGIYSTEEPSKTYWMAHEFVGHGFTLLADEYVSDCDYMGGPAELRRMQQHGLCLNVAATDSLTETPWKDFVGRPGYEAVGAYKGGFYCAEGVWRPEDYSIMVYGRNDGNPPYYNAQSRWLIYKKIHELAGVDFSFDSFLDYDKQFIR